MAKKQESKLRSAVKEAWHPLHVVAVENGLAGPGTPDVNYGGSVASSWFVEGGLARFEGTSQVQLDGWVELKRAHLPERPLTQKVDVVVRKEQPPWWELRRRAGGHMNVLLEIDNPRGEGRGLNLWFESQAAHAALNKTRLAALCRAAKSVWCPPDMVDIVEEGLGVEIEMDAESTFKYWLRRCLLR